MRPLPDHAAWRLSAQENVGVVRGLLVSLLGFVALGLVACDDDDDETATTEAEATTMEFEQDPPARGRVAVEGGPDVCADLPWT
jgi:hypothetical protein